MENVVPGESNIPKPFDVRTIKYLIRLMCRNDLTEIDLREGDLRIRLRRGPQGVKQDFTAVPAAAGGLAAAVAPSRPEEPSAKHLIEIKSPTPGTFYAAPNAESEAYVRVGSRVEPSTVVCLIEAMKVFNEIQAECSGTIVAILVENQQPVEYGQVLFKVDPTG